MLLYVTVPIAQKLKPSHLEGSEQSTDPSTECLDELRVPPQSVWMDYRSLHRVFERTTDPSTEYLRWNEGRSNTLREIPFVGCH